MYFNDQTGIFLCVEKPKNISADHTGGPRCGASSVLQSKGKTE